MKKDKPVSQGVKILKTYSCRPGETKLEPIGNKTAERIAAEFYDVVSVTMCTVGCHGTYAVKTHSGYEATIGTIDGKFAIIHKTNDACIRRVNILEVEEMP